jgi:hypothetical protein
MQFAVIHLEALPRASGAFFRAARNCLRVKPVPCAIRRPFSVPLRPSSLQPYSGRGRCPSKLPHVLLQQKQKKEKIATEVHAIHPGIARGQ